MLLKQVQPSCMYIQLRLSKVNSANMLCQVTCWMEVLDVVTAERQSPTAGSGLQHTSHLELQVQDDADRS